MTKFLFQQGKFVVLENCEEFIIRNIELEYKNHAHIKKNRDREETLKIVKNLIHLLENKICPKSSYLKGSALRLLTHKEFKELKVKEKYYNSQKGVRK